MYKYKLLLGLLLFLSVLAHGQVDNQVNSWWTYSGNHAISSKFSVHTLYSWRRSDFASEWQQSLLRVAVNYHFTDKLTFTPGYDWVVTFPYGEQPIDHQTTEHRIYEQIMLKSTFDKVGVSHLYRIEQRFSNQNLKHRFRYRLSLSLPLLTSEEGKQKIVLAFFDEVFFNLGKQALGSYFDQNWFYLGLDMPLNNGVVLKLGYMDQYILKADHSHIENNRTPQFGLAYNFDFHKKS